MISHGNATDNTHRIISTNGHRNTTNVNKEKFPFIGRRKSSGNKNTTEIIAVTNTTESVNNCSNKFSSSPARASSNHYLSGFQAFHKRLEKKLHWNKEKSFEKGATNSLQGTKQVSNLKSYFCTQRDDRIIVDSDNNIILQRDRAQQSLVNEHFRRRKEHFNFQRSKQGNKDKSDNKNIWAIMGNAHTKPNPEESISQKDQTDCQTNNLQSPVTSASSSTKEISTPTDRCKGEEKSPHGPDGFHLFSKILHRPTSPRRKTRPWVQEKGDTQAHPTDDSNGTISNASNKLDQENKESQYDEESRPHPQRPNFLGKRLLTAVDHLLHPPSKLIPKPQSSGNKHNSRNIFSNQKPNNTTPVLTRRSPKIMLYGSSTPEEHFDAIARALKNGKGKRGRDGLLALGFDYRVMPCSLHDIQTNDGKDVLTDMVQEEGDELIDFSSDKVNDCNQEDFKTVTSFENKFVHEHNHAATEEKKDDSDHNNAFPRTPDTSSLSETSGNASAISNYEAENHDENQLHITITSLASSTNENTVSLQDDISTEDSKIDNNTLNTIKDKTSLISGTKIFNSTSQQKPTIDNKNKSKQKISCDDCRTCLYHIETQTTVTANNRTQFIADGQMYEEVSRLCQEYAQDIMEIEGSLRWVTVCNGRIESKDSSVTANIAPIRMLVSQCHPCCTATGSMIKDNDDGTESQPGQNCDKFNNGSVEESSNESKENSLLLITTGKGKVRAGIFSRHHLITNSLETSTALPMVREARKRGMSVAVLDPNARGDRNGMDTYEKSMEVLFRYSEVVETQDINEEENSSVVKQEEDFEDMKSPRSGSSSENEKGDRNRQSERIYILAHSASGAQLVRYLMEQSTSCLRSQICAIAFTDSTHSIQWVLKKEQQQNAECKTCSLSDLLQSKRSLYIRSANEFRDNDWESKKPGDEYTTDNFWEHRFGKIRTVCAGTKDHSLSNWEARQCIWNQFDDFFYSKEEG